MLRYLAISPHDDDIALFLAFTAQRVKPDIAIVLDSYIQPQRGEIGCSAEERAKETEKANKILGCKTIRLGRRDDSATEEEIEEVIRGKLEDYDVVYAPALQGGNIHHDMVNRASHRVFGDKVIEYTTYTKTQLHTRGETEVVPTLEELRLKNMSLNCYESQIRINLPHFQAVLNQSEWLNNVKLKKTFVVCMFGSTFSWFDQFVKQVSHLAPYGWEWLVVTPNDVQGGPNVRILKMTPEEFNLLVEKKLGVKSNVFLTEKGVPSVHMTDFYVFSGLIFEDYLKESNWWGIMNLDIVVGRLDRFLPDSELDKYDVWTDDVKVINGIFCLFRNRGDINRLCLEIPNWEQKLAQPPCNKCLGKGGNHTLFGTDEYDMTEVMLRVEAEGRARYGHPKYHPLHSHDRLEQHIPEVKLRIEEDGSLWELFEDIHGPEWIHARKLMGKEVAYYHFLRTKEWPKCLQDDIS